MEPVWEYKWAVWDEVKACFVPTPIWLTDEEARSDWYAYEMCGTALTIRNETVRMRLALASTRLHPTSHGAASGMYARKDAVTACRRSSRRWTPS